MAVSTPVIVAVTILGCCLVTTSALLVYKLRPGVRQESDTKWSRHGSDVVSPVRKMTLVHGMVVEDDPAKPKKSIFRRFSSLYTSRRASIVHSMQHGVPAMTTVDIEAQHDYDYEKSPRLSTEEVLNEDGTYHHSLIPEPQPAHIARSPLVSLAQVMPSALLPSKQKRMSINRKPLPTPTRSDSGRRYTVPRDLVVKTPQPRRTFDPSILKAASVSAAPPTAYSARATPAPSVISSITSEPEMRDQLLVGTSQLPSPVSSMNDDEPRWISRVKTRDLETIAETSPEYGPAMPLSKKLKKEDTGSISSMNTKSPRRAGKRRPPPIRTDSNDSAHLPTIARRIQQVQRGAYLTPDSDVDDPPASVPITPPVLSANITDLTTPLPYFNSSQGKDRQSMATIASSQYPSTFSLVDAQRTPLPIQQGQIRSSSKLANAKSIIESFPATPTSANTPISPKAPIMPPKSATKPDPTRSKRSPFLHHRRPSALASHPPNSASLPRTPVTAPVSGTSDRPSRRPSRYSHLMDKDLPPPPPAESPEPPAQANLPPKSIPTPQQLPPSNSIPDQTPSLLITPLPQLPPQRGSSPANRHHSPALTNPFSTQTTTFPPPHPPPSLSLPPPPGTTQIGSGRSRSLSSASGPPSATTITIVQIGAGRSQSLSSASGPTQAAAAAATTSTTRTGTVNADANASQLSQSSSSSSAQAEGTPLPSSSIGSPLPELKLELQLGLEKGMGLDFGKF